MFKNTYFLLLKDNVFSIQEIYDRLLSIFIKEISYKNILFNDLIQNAIIIETTLQEKDLLNEIKEVLTIIGYYDRFMLTKCVM
jgi:hypothetical protein